MKWLNKCILITLLFSLISVNLICIEIVCADKPIATSYDRQQDVDINRNIRNIDNNIDYISDNESNISSNLTEIDNNTNRINDLDNRVEELEETQYVYEQEFKIIDTKKWEIKPLIRTNFTRSKVDTIGVRATFKFGQSYEEKLINEQNTRINRLEQLLKVRAINNIKTIKTNTGWTIDTQNSPIISLDKEW